jgi:tetratricopeptide (TPR) repeat protein
MHTKFVSLCACLVPLLGAGLCLTQAGAGKQAEFAAHSRKAETYLREQRPDFAIPELQAAAAIHPEDVDTQGNLGVLLFFQGKAAEAIPHLRVAVEKQPSLAKIQGILGIAELRTEDIEQGRKDLETAFPSITDAKIKVLVGLELVGSYTQIGDLDQAAEVLAQLKKAAPANPEVLYAEYQTYFDLSAEARLALSLAAPDSAQMHQLLAHEEITEGNTNRAIAQFRMAIAIDPRLPGVHFELAELLNTASDPAIRKEAIEEYRIALEQNPRDEKAICRLGEIAAQKGDVKQAYDDYSKAVALQPADADAKLGLAKALIEMDEPDKALPLLEASVQLEPTNSTAHYRLSTLYRKMGRIEDARREVELYKKYKDMKEKLRALYKDVLIRPEEIRADDQDDK